MQQFPYRGVLGDRMEISVVEGGNPVGRLQLYGPPQMAGGRWQVAPLPGAQGQRVMIVIGIRPLLQRLFEGRLGRLEISAIEQRDAERVKLVGRLCHRCSAHSPFAHFHVHLGGMGQPDRRAGRRFGEQLPGSGEVFFLKSASRSFKYQRLLFSRIDGLG